MTIQEGHTIRVALLHGAGYTGAELMAVLLAHPAARLCAVTSRSFAGRPVWHAHPKLRGRTDLEFSDPETFSAQDVDAVFVAAEHGRGAVVLSALLASGYEGLAVDLSADFRSPDPEAYRARYGGEHPAPHLLPHFAYGLAEVNGPYPADTRYVANPGCFATGIALALWPVSRAVPQFEAAVTALTGASGSGALPSSTTHFPTRDGNVRSYRELEHQHMPEVMQVLGAGARVDFIPVSGPWTRGIWGTATVRLDEPEDPAVVASWFGEAYRGRPFVRLWPDRLPELRWSVHTPYCDIGWIVRDRTVVVGFALDNLLKGAASQAVQNLNLITGRPETEGLIDPAPVA